MSGSSCFESPVVGCCLDTSVLLCNTCRLMGSDSPQLFEIFIWNFGDEFRTALASNCCELQVVAVLLQCTTCPYLQSLEFPLWCRNYHVPLKPLLQKFPHCLVMSGYIYAFNSVCMHRPSKCPELQERQTECSEPSWVRQKARVPQLLSKGMPLWCQ